MLIPRTNTQLLPLSVNQQVIAREPSIALDVRRDPATASADCNGILHKMSGFERDPLHDDDHCALLDRAVNQSRRDSTECLSEIRLTFSETIGTQECPSRIEKNRLV